MIMEIVFVAFLGNSQMEVLRFQELHLLEQLNL